MMMRGQQTHTQDWWGGGGGQNRCDKVVHQTQHDVNGIVRMSFRTGTKKERVGKTYF